jgi:predicted AAA+ superfamily ATPase
LEYPVSYWRTSSGFEVDFILGDHQIAVEIKSTDNVNLRHLKGLRAFSEEYKVEKQVVVSNDPYPRLIDNILILPWKVFLERLWNGEIIG